MRRYLAALAVVSFSAAMGLGPVLAEDPDNSNVTSDNNFDSDTAPSLVDLLPFPKLGPKAAALDLGIDLSEVPLTQQGLNSFLASLDPEAQRVLITSCAHYLTTPNSVQSTYTIQFCDTLLGG